MHFYTSINNAYLPKARILAKSVKQHCPGSTFSLVLSDCLPATVDATKEPFDEIVTLEQLGIKTDNLPFWIYTHSVVELCTAVKGQALVNFLQKYEKVAYLDPDIAVFDDLLPLEQLLDEYDIILTPHQTAPEDQISDVVSNEICSLQHGTYNFGFYAARNSANGMTFANWFAQRLLYFCVDDKVRGLFTDQKWGDLVPALFAGVYIWRHPGCNVSTWNLTHRFVQQIAPQKYSVNGESLLFFHFSGFDSGAQKNMLDRYSKGNTTLYAMRDWYIEQLRLAEQDTYGNMLSIYHYYDDGELITTKQRALLRSREDLRQTFGKTNPFCKQGDHTYYDWYADECRRLNCMVADEVTTVEELRAELNQVYASRAWKVALLLKRIWKIFKFRGK